ncbi:MAG TPA: HAD-IA family hydrolase [Burkholderiales bacterium]|nr:HAD-IA family hydrolase [Burkholderiales bacterium]
MIEAVLFDLDGTFADTAPDLTRALNAMRAARGLAAVAIEDTRPVTSTGARGMLRVGFGLTPEHPEYAGMRQQFLEQYEQNLCVDSVLFAGMRELLDGLEARRLKWGIVTNKAERYAIPLVGLLGVHARCACVIGGDTTGVTKPNPAPLLEACRRLNVAPAAAVYVGDDQRDVEAGRAAGMRTIAVRYGYLNGSEPDTWGADAVVDCPQDVLAYL